MKQLIKLTMSEIMDLDYKFDVNLREYNYAKGRHNLDRKGWDYYIMPTKRLKTLIIKTIPTKTPRQDAWLARLNAVNNLYINGYICRIQYFGLSSWAAKSVTEESHKAQLHNNELYKETTDKIIGYVKHK